MTAKPQANDAPRLTWLWWSLKTQFDKRSCRYEHRVEKLEDWRLDEAYAEGNKSRTPERQVEHAPDGGRTEQSL